MMHMNVTEMISRRSGGVCWRLGIAVVLGLMLLGCKEQGKDMPNAPANKVEVKPHRPDSDWVRIEGGRFKMGRKAGKAAADEQFVHDETVALLDVMRHEVTVAEYQACVQADVCWTRIDKQKLSGRCNDVKDANGELPMNCIDWYQANSYCAWAGGRLPSEAEWEYFASNRGKSVAYPWGNAAPSCERAAIGIKKECEGLQKVCTHALGNTEAGLCDIVGNVSEWTQDWYYPTYDYAQFMEYNGIPPLPDAKVPGRVARGSAAGFVDVLTVGSRMRHVPEYQDAVLGVRCVRDVPGERVKSAYEQFHEAQQSAKRFVGLKAVKGDGISRANAEGFAWNRSPNVVIPAEGIRIEYAKVVKAKHIEISFDNNDRYILEFMLNGKLLGVLTLGPKDNPKGGMVTYKESLPENVGDGFDQVVITISTGDSFYSVGHIVYN